MVRLKKALSTTLAICVIMGTAAGAVATRVSRNFHKSSELCVVVDAGHGAYV